MDIESVRDFCLSLPLVTEDMAFGEDLILFRVCDKIFVCLAIDGSDYLALKCNPDYALDLRDRYPEIEPAYHWNKKYWNQVSRNGSLKPDFIKHMIRHSYAEVTKKLPKKVKAEFPEIMEVNGGNPEFI